ncbi:MFS transporter [Actinoplanes sp. NPDC026619]|uniref:MFS transporter n=1 Tax=Actinoplanes sp. NPDC026619 TaxID=3155798 RepID=UPI0033D90E1F
MPHEETAEPSAGRRATWIGAGYAAQGFGYAAVVTALPAFKDRQGIDDAYVSVILLLVCVAAAGGSVLADKVAARWGSRFALSGGLLTVAVGLGLTAFHTPTPIFTAILIAYGVGLGAVDASLSMQGVLVQARIGRSVMSRLFAAYTAAAILAALLMSGFSASGNAAALAVGAAAVVAAVVAGGSFTSLEPGRTVMPELAELAGEKRHDGTRHIVWVCGAFIFTAFLADSAVSTWSSVYLDDSLTASAAVVPLGYAAYQAAVLVARLAGDHIVPRLGRIPSAAACLLICAAGCGIVVAVPSIPVAIAGFGLTGIGVGVLVPLAFSSAGEAAPGHSDEVIARVNLFNYGGALVGAVLLGALSDPIGLRLGFLIPVLGLLATIPVVRSLRHLATAPTTMTPPATAPR